MKWLLSLIDLLMAHLYPMSEDNLTEIPLQTPDLPPNQPVEAPSKAEMLYLTALECLKPPRDMSPLDKAPDSLACMESVDGVYFTAFGEHLLKPEDRLSTARGYAAMRTDPRLRKIDVPVEGCIVISPTGLSTKGSSHGHCGVWGKHDVMSNDSNSGIWQDNYTHESWYRVFHDTLGFPVYFFIPV